MLSNLSLAYRSFHLRLIGRNATIASNDRRIFQLSASSHSLINCVVAYKDSSLGLTFLSDTAHSRLCLENLSGVVGRFKDDDLRGNLEIERCSCNAETGDADFGWAVGIRGIFERLFSCGIPDSLESASYPL